MGLLSLLEMKEELKSAIITPMALSVMTSGMNRLLKLCVEHSIVSCKISCLIDLIHIYILCSIVSQGTPVNGRDSVYGSGTGMITLDNVVCNGSEQDLLHCSHSDIMVHNCDHNEDAAVICGSKLLRIL